MSNQKTGSEFSRHWLLVLVCAVGIGVGVSSLPFYTQGLFIEAWIADFGWTRAQASLGILGSTLALAAVLPFIGSIVDRYGLVTPVMISLLGLSLAYVLLGMFVQSIATFVILAMLQAILGSASSPLAYTRAINAVFNKQRGLALGVALSGAGVAATFGPTLISNAIDAFGWRGAYYAMALFTLVVGAVIILVLSRLNGAKTAVNIDMEAANRDFLVAKASRTYWTIMAAIFCLSLGLGGLMIHFVPILLDVGFATNAAVKIAGVIGIAVVLGRLLVGFAVDRIFAPRVAIAILLACISGVLALALLGSVVAVPAAFVIGFSVGAEVDLIGYLVARYFGMHAYGQIYGRQYSTFLIATGLSPVILGAVRDATGTYTASLFTAAAFMVISAALFAKLPKFEQ
ncbi:MFS transporter [Porticoccaceae bacterium]|jgi:MFS family permease|nr:MFS transporter [Porticoccaceae bacterium]MDA8599083.1 MFS transporter [Porticoccaceae bacterium]MDA8879236.1 MFS transporter [Porticoccaceae bacterium]MDA8940962.1 MFS transporter [Porticoccaceae bacterium]MDA9582946.1 MFS transporter [Porticoccaceae bacterium]|tara:strand:+ start:1150 stop:2352 length:1203 start_codon:yes stop_codon:yes gene_type:complete